jgi:hypothetical protein
VALLVTNLDASGFGGLVVSMLDSGTQDRGFEPGMLRIFSPEKSDGFGRV